MKERQLRELQETIGYEFKDRALLKQALTHSSYANENRGKGLWVSARSSSVRSVKV